MTCLPHSRATGSREVSGDTHVWLWLLESPGKISPTVRVALERADDIVLSVASVWELAIKVKLGKIVLPSGVSAARDVFLSQAGARELAIQSAHAVLAAELPPCTAILSTELLIAQAQYEKLTLVTADEAIRRYELPIAWAI
jgi:PIN domain nuclease of toxin-antitoxin system